MTTRPRGRYQCFRQIGAHYVLTPRRLFRIRRLDDGREVLLSADENSIGRKAVLAKLALYYPEWVLASLAPWVSKALARMRRAEGMTTDETIRYWLAHP